MKKGNIIPYRNSYSLQSVLLILFSKTTLLSRSIQFPKLWIRGMNALFGIYGNKISGAYRYRAFWEIMQSLYQRYSETSLIIYTSIVRCINLELRNVHDYFYYVTTSYAYTVVFNFYMDFSNNLATCNYK